MNKEHINYTLLFLAIFFIVSSSIFLSCLSSTASLQRFGTTNYYLIHQVLSGYLPGIILGFIAYRISLKFIKKWTPLFVVLNIAALFSVFIPGLGFKAGGASRWVDLGFFSFQPSEILKITAILYLSAWIASKLSEESVSGWKEFTKKSYHNVIYIFLPFIIFLGVISIALYFQRDVSTLGIITLTLLNLYFTSRTPLWHTLLIVASGVTILLLLVKFEPYRLDRWMVFLHPQDDPLGKGLQLKQSLISLGSGGVFGKGLGMSAEKFFLPEPMTDSIFAIIGEEMGMIGGLVLVAAFVYLFWIGIKIAKKSTDRFSKMMAVGIVTWITLQAFINMAQVAGIFPVAGIPLPFFSYGGTHVVVELVGIGLLLNISKNT